MFNPLAYCGFVYLFVPDSNKLVKLNSNLLFLRQLFWPSYGTILPSILSLHIDKVSDVF